MSVLIEPSVGDVQNALRTICWALRGKQLRWVSGDLVELDGIMMRTQEAADILGKTKTNDNEKHKGTTVSTSVAGSRGSAGEPRNGDARSTGED